MVKTILLLRHGEECEASNSLDLSGAGRVRAENLAKYVPKTFGTPDIIYSAAPTGSSVRCYLTMRPLADAIKLTIKASYKSVDFGALAYKLFADPAYSGKMVVVCWTHTELPALAGCLNVDMNEFPVEWEDAVFDRIYRLNYRGRPRPKVKLIKQPF